MFSLILFSSYTISFFEQELFFYKKENGEKKPVYYAGMMKRKIKAKIEKHKRNIKLITENTALTK